MPVAEIFIGALVTVLFEKLASGELMKLANLGGIDDKLKKWSKKLGIIDTLLGDAEEKQLTQKTVQQWLGDLRDLSYDIEDVLDELETEVLRRKLMMLPEEQGASSSSSTGRKVWKLIPTCCVSFTPTAFMFDLRISSKIDEITSRLNDLEDRKSDLNLSKNVIGRSDKIADGSRTTTSLVVESRVYGRQEDKAKIVSLLLKESTNSHTSGEVCVLPIVGMGGLGKTTLAQYVYNDEQVEAHFVLRAWLCIGEDFDRFRMTDIIYRSVAKDGKEFKNLDVVQVSLKEKLSNKRFLIVLDDVWNENYGEWELFCAPFLFGAPGSAIIVTTRNGDIAKFMGSIEAHQLQPLEDNDCLSLIAQHALRKQNFDAHPDLKDVGEEIAKKCKGLPLAAKTLGGILCRKLSLTQWKDILTSKIWDLPADNNDIIPALRLSYHHLPPHLKHLFAYCSIFPKDTQFDVHELIMLWMAEGFLKESRQKQMEELGLEYFHELLSRSFFQCSGDNETRYVMHDLMNDLAQFVAGEICFRMDNHMESEETYKVLPNTRHSSFIRHECGAFKKFEAFESDGVQSLRTFLPLPIYRVNKWPRFFLSNKVLTDLLPQLLCLRVLSFSGYEICEVPKSIGHLKHLRYLDFSHTKITELPEFICGLHNLQTLLLRGCDSLIQLPQSIGKLLNLRHLDMADTSALKQMPSGLGMLKSLRTLSKFVIGESNGLKLSELKVLKHLQGRLCIDGMQHVKNVQDAAAADLLGKKHIKEMVIRWGWSSSSDDSQGEELESAVLEVLKPQEGLESLEIEFFRGTKFPGWVGNPSFSSMAHLTLRDCRKCTSLPSLGHLPSLRELFIEGMDGVRTVGRELFGDGLSSLNTLPSLETLSFKNMAGWEELFAHLPNGDKNVKGFSPRLSKLEISKCPKLIKVSLPQIPSLVELELRSCGEMVLRSITSSASVKTMRITDISRLARLDEGVIQSLGELEDLIVEDCDEIKYLWQEEVACQKLFKLRDLKVIGCKQLESLGEKEQLLPHKLESLKLSDCPNLERMPSCCESLKKLRIYSCLKLQYCEYSPAKNEEHQDMDTMSRSIKDKYAQGFPNLQVLEVHDCSSLTWLPTGKKLPSSLKSLDISFCDNLEKSPLEEEEEEELESSLESICLNGLKNLKSIPNRWLFGFYHLTEMEIFNCPGIDFFRERCFPASLRVLTIVRCKNLKYLSCNEDHTIPCLESLQKLKVKGCKNLMYLWDDDQMMQRLTSLQKLRIKGCKKLESFPNGIWPPNLKYLSIGNVKQPITSWGLDKLPTSLTTLTFVGEIPELVSFSQVEIRTTSLTKLTSLHFWNLENLESLSAGHQNLLPSLQVLLIDNCPKLQTLPETLLPNLSRLFIGSCPRLKEKCMKDKTNYWPFISQIPLLQIEWI